MTSCGVTAAFIDRPTTRRENKIDDSRHIEATPILLRLNIGNINIQGVTADSVQMRGGRNAVLGTISTTRIGTAIFEISMSYEFSHPERAKAI